MASADGSFAAAVALLLYLNTLPSGFVFDDHPAIEQNSCVQRKDGWKHLLSTDFWGTPLDDPHSHRSYRPLAVLTLWANRQIDPTGGARSFHAANGLLHGCVTWLVWSAASVTLPSRSTAMAAALLFAAHPVNTEAVAYCVGRADLLV